MSDQTSLQKEIAKIEALIASLRDALTGDALAPALLPLEQKRNQLIAQLSGAGAVAQGENAVAAGQDATVIQHSTIVYAAAGARVVIGDQPVEMKAELRNKALGRYLEHIIAHNRYLQLQGIRSGGKLVNIELEHIYITLRTTQKRTLQAEDAWLKYERENAPGEMQKRADQTANETISVKVEDALAAHRHLVVLGDPGSGKTTLLRYLALLYARDLAQGSTLVREKLNLEESGYLPILLPLRQIGAFLRAHRPNADGTGVTKLTDNQFYDNYPTWSPDGSRIVFQSNRNGNDEIYVMSAKGSDVIRLTDNPAYDSFPLWSPDGMKIVFQSDRDGNNEIYVVNADGSEATNLTKHPVGDTLPVWSPDGTKILFQSDRDGNHDIYKMNPDGSGITNLSNHPAYDFARGWSPDGRRIAFESERDGNKEIYIMNSDGSNVINLTNSPMGDWFPRWSPDGMQIIFLSNRDGNSEIYMMNVDGSGVTNLTNSPENELYPVWSPDGSRIAFEVESAGNAYEIFVMSADGRSKTNLTNSPDHDWAPDWYMPQE